MDETSGNVLFNGVRTKTPISLANLEQMMKLCGYERVGDFYMSQSKAEIDVDLDFQLIPTLQIAYEKDFLLINPWFILCRNQSVEKMFQTAVPLQAHGFNELNVFFFLDGKRYELASSKAVGLVDDLSGGDNAYLKTYKDNFLGKYGVTLERGCHILKCRSEDGNIEKFPASYCYLEVKPEETTDQVYSMIEQLKTPNGRMLKIKDFVIGLQKICSTWMNEQSIEFSENMSVLKVMPLPSYSMQNIMVEEPMTWTLMVPEAPPSKCIFQLFADGLQKVGSSVCEQLSPPNIVKYGSNEPNDVLSRLLRIFESDPTCTPYFIVIVLKPCDSQYCAVKKLCDEYGVVSKIVPISKVCAEATSTKGTTMGTVSQLAFNVMNQVLARSGCILWHSPKIYFRDAVLVGMHISPLRQNGDRYIAIVASGTSNLTKWISHCVRVNYLHDNKSLLKKMWRKVLREVCENNGNAAPHDVMLFHNCAHEEVAEEIYIIKESLSELQSRVLKRSEDPRPYKKPVLVSVRETPMFIASNPQKRLDELLQSCTMHANASNNVATVFLPDNKSALRYEVSPDGDLLDVQSVVRIANASSHMYYANGGTPSRLPLPLQLATELVQRMTKLKYSSMNDFHECLLHTLFYS